MSWNTKEETSRRRVTTQQLLTWESTSPAESLGRMWDKGESIHHNCNSTSPRAERSSATPMKLVNSSLLLRPWMAKDSCIKMIKESWEMEFTLKQVVRSGQSLSREWLPFKFFFFTSYHSGYVPASYSGCILRPEDNFWELFPSFHSELRSSGLCSVHVY